MYNVVSLILQRCCWEVLHKYSRFPSAGSLVASSKASSRCRPDMQLEDWIKKNPSSFGDVAQLILMDLGFIGGVFCSESEGEDCEHGGYLNRVGWLLRIRNGSCNRKPR